MSLLQAHGLSLEVSGRLLVDALDLEIRAGECWAILGPNGSGKTTLLHTLAGLRPPQAGEIRLNGTPLQQLERRAIARQLGLLLQDSHDPFPVTVLESVLSGRHPHLERWQSEGEEDLAIARQALQQMALQDMEQRTTQSLSGGERRRAAMATLLAQSPPLMLLDEPLNHLDLRHQKLLLETVGERCQTGHAVLMVLHDPNQAIGRCDKVLLLPGDGRHLQGEARELLTAERLSELYGFEINELEQSGKRWFGYL